MKQIVLWSTGSEVIGRNFFFFFFKWQRVGGEKEAWGLSLLYQK